MKSTTARRELFVLFGTIMAGSALSGCLSIRGEGNEEDQTQMKPEEEENGNDTENERHDENTATEHDGGCGTDRLPEPSPLANPLPDLVEADDREAFANEHGLDYRNGEVKVEIELEPDGERPDEYLSEVIDEFGRLIIAWVEIDNLVDLALDENVRRVQPTTEPKTDAPG